MKNLNHPLKGQNGFTLVELLISTVLTLSLLGAVYGVYKVQARNLKVQDDRLAAQEYARSVVDLIVREIRNAGFAPNGGGCGVLRAEAQVLQFTYDANANGLCVTDANENITYGFDTTGCPNGFGNITRKDGLNDPQALTDCNVPTGAANFSFTYFQQNSATALATPVTGLTLATIQRVVVTVAIQSKNPDLEFGGQLTVTMTSNADLRNRGLPAS
ncbi:MAG: hypothetical protein A3F90_19740 [Deltaproteobacteria bacterium RIFCSPLOWO2_12_FULL_60_19]|nr:MAG: hypothetical protein A3F90_19740 [Deltaproteobacteria bacterium RIFCSPLOWO2_12_FULL_60_19]